MKTSSGQKKFLATVFLCLFCYAACLHAVAAEKNTPSLKTQKNVKEALGENVSLKAFNSPLRYYQISRNETPIAYLFLSEELGLSKEGYGAPIHMAVLCSPDGSVLSVFVVAHKETDRYFKKMEAGGLLQKWRGLKASDEQPDAVSGATFTSNAINNGVGAVLQKLKNEKFFENLK